MLRATILLALVLQAHVAAAADTPAALAGRLQKALKAADSDALLPQAAGMAHAPAAQHFLLLSLLDDCAAPVVCSVTPRPLDSDWEAQFEKTQADGYELAGRAEGLLEIVGRPGGVASADPTTRVRLPYGKVAAGYRILAARPTSTRLATLGATTALSAAEAAMAPGVYIPALGETEKDWKQKARALPADGGAPGAAFVAGVKALAAAVQAKDPDAAAAATGEWGLRVLGAKDWDGRVRSAAERQRRLRLQSVRFVLDAKVLGGYEKGDVAVLVVEGRNGVGATVRGAVTMSREDGVWRKADDSQLVEIVTGTPAEPSSPIKAGETPAPPPER